MAPPFSGLFKKRKKAKQDLPGSSSQPASQSSTQAPTPNLIPSAADNSSKADLAVTTPDNASNRQEDTSPHHSVKATALNVVKLTLETLGKAGDINTFKVAMEGLLFVIEKVQVCSRISDN